jgi:hypothetical protein
MISKITQQDIRMYVNAKMIPVDTVPRIRKGGKFKYDIFDTL